VLGDTAGFARDDIGRADAVEDRGLAMVNVPHDNYDRRTRFKILVLVFGIIEEDVFFCHFNQKLALDAKFISNQSSGVKVYGLV